MRVEELPRAKRAWNDFIRKNGGGFLQSYEWGQFRAELEWQISYVAVFDGSAPRLMGLVMKRQIPGGFSFLYCPEGPVVAGGDWDDPANQKAFAAFAAYLERRAKRERIMFVKIDPHLPADEFPTSWLEQQGFTDSPEDIQASVITEVDLSPKPEQIFAKMKQKGRYHIRKAVQNGVTVKKSRSAAALDTFYDLYEQTAKRQGITYREKWYFELMRKHLMQQSNIAEFYIGKHAGQPVAATLVTCFGYESVYLYGGSTQADRNLYASYLVQWSAMEEAKKRGCTFYNMTGIAATDDPADPWAGLRQFKLKFGGPQIQLVGARDYAYRPVAYHFFSNLERIRRKLAKASGR